MHVCVCVYVYSHCIFSHASGIQGRKVVEGTELRIDEHRL